MQETLYNTLKVREDAPPEIIRAAYKALSGMYHPDKHNNSAEANELMQKINEAYRILRDPELRARYDESLCKARAKEAEQKRANEPPRASPPPQESIKPKAQKKPSAWLSWLPLICGVIAVKLLGFVGALSAMGLYYWVKPRKGVGVAAIAAIVGGSAATVVAMTALQVQQPTQQASAVAQATTPRQQTTSPSIYNQTSKPTQVESSTVAPTPSAQETHMRKIYAAHPDADVIFASQGFAYWLERTPQYKNTPSQGTTQEVIDMFSSYKRERLQLQNEVREMVNIERSRIERYGAGDSPEKIDRILQ